MTHTRERPDSFAARAMRSTRGWRRVDKQRRKIWWTHGFLVVNFSKLSVTFSESSSHSTNERCREMSRSSFHCPQSITLSRELLCADACLMANAHTKVGYSRLINATFRLRNTRGKQKSRVSAPFSSFILFRGRGTNHRPREGGGWWRSPAMHRRPQRWISRCRPNRPHRHPLVPPSGRRYSTRGVISSGDEKTRR